jgi:uncharacterized protein
LNIGRERDTVSLVCIYRKTDFASLFEKLGITYLERPRIAVAEIAGVDFRQDPYYAANREEFATLTARYGGLLREGRTADLRIRETEDGRGYGLFSARDLSAGAFIGEYCGVVRVAEEVDGNTGGYATDYAWEYPVSLPDGTPLELDASREGNELRFANHGFSPNLAVEHTLVDGRWAIFFVAAKDIAAEEECIVDYGLEYWTGGFRELILGG